MLMESRKSPDAHACMMTNMAPMAALRRPAHPPTHLGSDWGPIAVGN